MLNNKCRIYIAFLFLLSLPAFGRQRVFGQCSQGGKTVTTSGIVSTTKVLASYPSCTVTVYLSGTLTLATLYGDNSSTPKSNPFVGDVNGYWFYYADNGRYDTQMSGAGMSTWTQGDVLLADPAGFAAAVNSFNGRTGSVVPLTGDYSYSMITGTAPVVSFNARTGVVLPTAGDYRTLDITHMPFYVADDFNFSAQTRPGGLNLSIGSNTLTFTSVPVGMNGTNINYYVYISGGSGTAEAALVTGGTAISGTTGTLIITCRSAHTGAWTISSINGGVNEAEWALTSAGGYIIANGAISAHGPFYNRPIPMFLIAFGWEATTFTTDATSFPCTVNTAGCAVSGAGGVPLPIFNWTQNPPGNAILPGGMSGFTIICTQPDSTNLALYVHWTGVYFTDIHRAMFRDLVMRAVWDGFKSPSNDGISTYNITISPFHYGYDIDGATDTVRAIDTHAWPAGLTTDQSTTLRSISTGNVLFHFGNVQDFKITNFSSIIGGGPFLGYSGVGGSPVGQISNSDPDTFGTFQLNDGNVEATNIQMSMLGAVNGFVVHGGLLTLHGGTVQVNNGVTGVPFLININQAATGAATLITPGLIASGVTVINYENVNTVQATTSGAFAGTAQVSLSQCRFQRATNTIYATATINQLTGTGRMLMSVNNNYFSDVGGGSYTSVFLQDDDDHIIVDNYGGGSSISVAGKVNTMVAINHNFTGNVNRLLDPTKVFYKFTAASMVNLIAENYIATESGSNNAIAGTLVDADGVAVPLAAGLRVTIILAHTLQIGANTFALNGGAAKSIKRATNPANNTDVAYVVGSIITIVYDGTVWQLISR